MNNDRDFMERVLLIAMCALAFAAVAALVDMMVRPQRYFKVYVIGESAKGADNGH